MRSLLKQSVQPDRLILWIAESDKDLVPDDVLALQGTGLEIKYCEDFRSYKKIVGSAKENPTSFIVTADDDFYYPPTWLEELVAAWDGNPRTIVTWRAHGIKAHPNGHLAPYAEWHWNVQHTQPSPYIFPTTGAGTLFTPGTFNSTEALNENLFTRLCPDCDDIWLYWIARKADRLFRTVGKHFEGKNWAEGQEEALWHHNIRNGGNDRSIKAMEQHFGRLNLPAIGDSKSFDSGAYWSQRYRRGGHSGAGSYGRLAEFKAEIINKFVADEGISSVIEFGCGDGAQLDLARYPRYLGFDVAHEAVTLCRERFRDDATKQFLHTQEYVGQKADLSLSLDVIYHLIEDDVFSVYMTNLFNAADRFVVIYASNFDEVSKDYHVRHRQFTAWVAEHRHDFTLVKHIPNRYPLKDDPQNESFADFFIYRRNT